MLGQLLIFKAYVEFKNKLTGDKAIKIIALNCFS